MAPTQTSTSPTAPVSPPDMLHDLDTLGYTIVRSRILPELLERCLLSAQKLTSFARDGHWPHLRTCPKQFPPWPSEPGPEGIWGVQHLLHPALYRKAEGSIDPPLTQEEAAAFAELYFSTSLLDPIANILRDPSAESPAEDPALTMELCNMLVSPPQSFSLRWHRDSISFDQSLESEAAALGLIQSSTAEASAGHGSHGGGHANPFAVTEHTSYVLHPAFRKRKHTQWNVPLMADSSLQVVPRSHMRPRTAEETGLLEKDAKSDALPGAVEVKLQPGDVVFYNNELIHRGVYDGHERDGGLERYTLHGSVSDARGSGERAQTVLQHDVGGWIGDANFGELLKHVHGKEGEAMQNTAEDMRKRLLDFSGNRRSDAVGYNHPD